MNEFAEFVETVSKCAEALRDLRQQEPEKFYGTPFANLLEGLESALNSYWHDKTP